MSINPSQGQELPEGSMTESGICAHRLAIGSSMQTQDKYGQATSQEQICCRSRDPISPSLKTHEYADVLSRALASDKDSIHTY
jgi:hypothetical protein